MLDQAIRMSSDNWHKYSLMAGHRSCTKSLSSRIPCNEASLAEVHRDRGWGQQRPFGRGREDWGEPAPAREHDGNNGDRDAADEAKCLVVTAASR